jgi:hypothetical protein
MFFLGLMLIKTASRDLSDEERMPAITLLELMEVIVIDRAEKPPQ